MNIGYIRYMYYLVQQINLLLLLSITRTSFEVGHWPRKLISTEINFCGRLEMI